MRTFWRIAALVPAAAGLWACNWKQDSGYLTDSEVCVPGSSEFCYTGPEGTLGVGSCTAGLKTCTPDGQGYGECAGEVLPQAEICANLVDDSCDGQVDEAVENCCVPGSKVACSGTPIPPEMNFGGNCYTAKMTCNAEGTGYGDCMAEPIECGYVSVSASTYSSSLALRADGTVWAWGNNGQGQLGIGMASDDVLVPTLIPNLDHVTAVAMSVEGHNSAALRSDGTVWTWGDNAQGALGNETIDETKNWTSPIPVGVTGLSHVIAIAAGSCHVLALRSDGTIWTWGCGTATYWGNGSPDAHFTPIQGPNIPDVTAIHAGYVWSFAVDSSGDVWAWAGPYGAPSKIPYLSQMTDFERGQATYLTVRAGGTVWGWGGNGSGLLGVPDQSQSYATPVAVPGLDSITAISMGTSHALALRSDGAVWSWGTNGLGELGFDFGGDLWHPPTAIPTISQVVAIAAGGGYSLVVRSDGTVWGWGSNAFGELGDGTAQLRVTPVQALLP